MAEDKKTTLVPLDSSKSDEELVDDVVEALEAMGVEVEDDG